ncbi:DUF3899 domain-containing protein [Sporolactobacillus shoreicorticis]|uniref:DUF3899 domain-containing protein n=1 Tax=Sporolactobacillus shoreicorticis TaxID=1923877 RepID=A0ABW5S604_9BACL|nr:DUF3899 domain-containing protein [Sporolactobacillus shoreicorticis]MCO7126671.1 DUF3899 domain-containing protein [Sporolactobacillus shoreicorticis]
MKDFFTTFRISFPAVAFFELILALFAQFFYKDPFSIRSIVDGLSTVSLLFFSAGLLLFVYQGGGFDGVVYSFRRFARSIRNRQIGENDAEAPLAEMKHHDGKKRASITWPLIIDSCLLFIASLLLSQM